MAVLTATHSAEFVKVIRNTVSLTILGKQKKQNFTWKKNMPELYKIRLTDQIYNIYECKDCGKQWKSYYKKIGHQKCPTRR